MITPEAGLVVYLVGVATGVVVMGYLNVDADRAADVAILSLFWPVVLPIAAVIGSAVLCYKAGQVLREWLGRE